MMIDERLKDWATDRQKAYVDAVNNAGSVRAAAVQLGVHHETIRDAMKRLQIHAATKGYSPEHNMRQTVPDPYYVKRRSQYYLEGQLHSEWVISSPDEERRFQMIQAGIEAAAQALAPEPTPSLIQLTNALLCNVYVMTDCHLGMMVSKAISGSREWNLEIAEEVLYRCFEQMVLQSPNAGTGILCQLGDFLHTDLLQALTPRSGHVLEVAATHEQIVQAAVRVLRRIVQLMLTKHDHVHIIMAEGNHDQVGSIWLRVIFSTLYEGNSRVTVDTSELPYYVYEHGKTMLAFHHGHEKKPLTLPLYFAARHSEMWGRATKRYGHTGHCHHEQKAGDETGMHMTQHPTLAPNDSHSSRKAYVSINQASCIVYHSEFGKVGEVVVTPEMLLAA